LPFLPESGPQNLPQATVQSTGREQAREESIDSQLSLPMDILSGSFETQEHLPIPSNVPVNTLTAAFIRIRQLEPPITSSRKDSNFPDKLHDMLGEMEKDGLQHVASWQPNGRCFVVHDEKLFVENVLPL
jgi:hypothetical protein